MLLLIILIGGMTSVHTALWGTVDDTNLAPAAFNQEQMKSPLVGDNETFAKTAKIFSSVFIENQGQVSNDEVLYYAASGRGGFAFAVGGILMNLLESRIEQSLGEFEDIRTHSFTLFDENEVETERIVQGYLLRLSFVDSNPVKPTGNKMLQWFSNYFLGNDSGKWRTNVPNYEEIM